MDKKNSGSLPLNYDPLKDQTYMSADMVAYFKQKLTKMLEDLIKEEELISLNKADFPTKEADYVESSQIEELSLEENLPLQNEDYLKREVEDALYRINLGTYGYCEETGDPIGVRRLLAFPMARYTTEVQRRKDELFRQR
jgi:DnaK suppressor protein